MGWNWWKRGSEERPSPQQQNESQPTSEEHNFSTFYSRSRTCRPDPQDDSYLICKEQVHNGKGQFQTQERVPNHSGRLQPQPYNTAQINQHSQPFPFQSLQNNMKQEFDQFQRQLSQLMTPFLILPSLFGRNQIPGFSEGDHQKRTQFNKQKTKDSTKSGEQGQYYFSHSECKDYDIKDI